MKADVEKGLYGNQIAGDKSNFRFHELDKRNFSEEDRIEKYLAGVEEIRSPDPYHEKTVSEMRNERRKKNVF